MASGGNQIFAQKMLEVILSGGTDHPLDFLVDRTTGKWLGRSHLDDLPAVQVGHLTSRHSGEPERLALEDADYNQKASWRGERQGAIFEKKAIEIGGVPIEIETARLYERLGLLRTGLVAAALEHPGWSPIYGNALPPVDLPPGTTTSSTGATSVGAPAAGGAAVGVGLLGVGAAAFTGLLGLAAKVLSHSDDVPDDRPIAPRASEKDRADQDRLGKAGEPNESNPGQPFTPSDANSTSGESGAPVRSAPPAPPQDTKPAQSTEKNFTPDNANSSDASGGEIYQPASAVVEVRNAPAEASSNIETLNYTGNDGLLETERFVDLPAIDASEAVSFMPLDTAFPSVDDFGLASIPHEADGSFLGDSGVLAGHHDLPISSLDQLAIDSSQVTDFGIPQDVGMSVGNDQQLMSIDLNAESGLFSVDPGHHNDGGFSSFDDGSSGIPPSSTDY